MNKLFFSFLFLSIYLTGNLTFAQYPHILVNAGDKQAVLDKVKQQAWAKSIFEKIDQEVGPYVERHQTNPQWILSRYLMNRIPGKRYTTVYADPAGQHLIGWSGDAPNPTVRVNTYLRSPITEKGNLYRKPAIGDLIPNDTSGVMNLLNPETGHKDWIDPQAYITEINGDINNLALDAAILYWLKGEEKYARFSADILDQWAKGVYYQEAVVGPCRTGLLDMQTLGDQSSRSLILAYDFVRPFMEKCGYDLHWYKTVFEKFASTLAFRGLWNNNWYAAESSTLVFSALSLEDKQQQNYYLQFVLQRDTINGSCGQLALPSTVAKWLTPDGHWKEPGGYHNYPVGNLLLASLALEKNGYDVFRKFPALFKASYAMLKYSFPNLTVGGFGDTGRASQNGESLETGLIGAVKYDQPELPEMLASMKKLIEGGIYQRDKSGIIGLLCYLPEIPETKSVYNWPRTGTLDFARYFLQRNGTDRQNGLMVGVQGASYNHNHCNGMAMELYGQGEVMGIDAGTGPNYEHPLHRNYYSQWAAHNTVVAAGSSSSVPFNGTAGEKNIGKIELAAMEPMSDQKAVSPHYSFTDTRYTDKSTNTNQSRTLAIIRTSDTTGYYIDIYRSDNRISNDYIYHNIGDRVTFHNEKGELLKTASSEYPLTGNDYPGFRFFTDVEKLEGYKNDLIASFSIQDEKSNDLFMQVLMPGSEGRTYFRATSLKTKTAGKAYNGKPLPVFTIHTGGEARSKPFIAVFEPYKGIIGNSVKQVIAEKRDDGSFFTALTIFNKNGSTQQVFQSVDCEKKFDTQKGSFKGYFGVIGFSGKKFESLYLGAGTEISNSGYSLKSLTRNGSGCLTTEGKNFTVSCNQETEIRLPLNSVKKCWLQQGSSRNELKITSSGSGVCLTVPSIDNGLLILE
jgi:hypothetical protein